MKLMHIRTATTLVLAIVSAAVITASQRSQQEISDEAAWKIHRAVMTLDTHKDISDRLADPSLKALADSGDPEGVRLFEKNEPTVDGTSQVDFPKMREGGLDAAFFIVYVGQERSTRADLPSLARRLSRSSMRSTGWRIATPRRSPSPRRRIR